MRTKLSEQTTSSRVYPMNRTPQSLIILDQFIVGVVIVFIFVDDSAEDFRCDSL